MSHPVMHLEYPDTETDRAEVEVLNEVADRIERMRDTSQAAIMRKYLGKKNVAASRMADAIKRLVDQGDILPRYGEYSQLYDVIKSMRISRAGYERIGRKPPLWVV